MAEQRVVIDPITRIEGHLRIEAEVKDKTIAYEGPKTFATLNVEGKYSWVKSPRWMEKPVEVGPLARLIVGYAKKNDRIRDAVDRSLREIGVEILRIIHSFDSCMACAVHLTDLADQRQYEVFLDM